MEELDWSNKMTIVSNNWMNAIKKPIDGRYYFSGFFCVQTLVHNFYGLRFGFLQKNSIYPHLLEKDGGNPASFGKKVGVKVETLKVTN